MVKSQALRRLPGKVIYNLSSPLTGEDIRQLGFGIARTDEGDLISLDTPHLSAA